MSRRGLSPFFFVSFTLYLLLTPERALAQWANGWNGYPCVPVSYWQIQSSPRVPVKSASSRTKLAQPTAAPPSAELVTAPVEKKAQPGPPVFPQISENAKPDTSPRKPGPAVREEGPFYDSFPIALKANQKPANDQCSVTFTNLSERGIKVRIADQERTLAAGESKTLPVQRQFVWQMEGREAQNEKIGPGDYALQIVIRR